jgi:uroporphyrin-III C-methyltransferase/precorrin-2 dehydrogenase/sirohydrochlorin ferrochelatase
MGPLAKLPLFVDLAGRRAVVAGGDAAAAWKAELLAAAGARVEVLTAAAGEDLTELARRGTSAGTIAIVERDWRPKDLIGAALAVCAAADDGEAARFQNAARAAGVPACAIDRPAFSDVQFGAIVNRSPVVIGISTDGAAPILAQAIRRRIETLLPPGLARWAEIAKSLRARAAALLPALRRDFWERFADLAFTVEARGPAVGDVERLLGRALATDPAASAPGTVTLVGAGPGDADLLTLKAIRALQAADVILYDDLVSDDVLELARREAKRLLVGKRGGRPSCRQDEINEMMVKLARQGRRVVRLKSGDPMIFGRAGEEIARLRGAGIAVEIVPGITSGLAMASALGVSLTHRDHAQSVRFVTGHARTGALPDDLDWRGLAHPRTTLIAYMAGRTAPELARRLMDAGLGPRTPVAIVTSVSRPDESRWIGDLAALSGRAVAESGAAPALIGIGAVFGTVADRTASLPSLARVSA